MWEMMHVGAKIPNFTSEAVITSQERNLGVGCIVQ